MKKLTVEASFAFLPVQPTTPLPHSIALNNRKLWPFEEMDRRRKGRVVERQILKNVQT